ncbi:MAG: hypothetical protein OXC63_13950 [Aestuariivita sp.]|nr:hypothetical protein [Aestuariivita sp.]MCY4348075.1 hypothetical protein [Aestuariivita sp.]
MKTLGICSKNVIHYCAELPNDFNKVRKNKATTEDLYLKSDPRKDAQGYLDALKKNELENFFQTHNAL